MKSTKKKLLILTDWYLPAVKAGGPVRSVSAIVNALKDQFDISVLTSDRDFKDPKPFENIEPNTWKRENGYRLQYVSPEKLDKTIAKEVANPYHKIYLNSFFSKHFTINVLRRLKKKDRHKVILAPRGMLAQGALGLKSLKKKVFLMVAKNVGLYCFITWHASTIHEKREILNVFPNAKIIALENLSPCKPAKYFSEGKGTGTLKLVFVSRISPKKNLLFLLKILREIDNPNISLDIYGPTEDMDYWNNCNEFLKNLDNCNYKGILHYEELQSTLKNYHLFVLPTLNENFGHIILEALNSSLPVLVSNNTPWKNLKSMNIGADIDLNSTEVWKSAIIEFAEMNVETYSEKRKAAWSFGQKKLNQNDLVKDYVELFS